MAQSREGMNIELIQVGNRDLGSFMCLRIPIMWPKLKLTYLALKSKQIQIFICMACL